MNKPLAYLVTSADGNEKKGYLADELWLHPNRNSDVITPLIAMPSPLSEDEERARFEVWIMHNYTWCGVKKFTDGKEYSNERTFNYWVAWQAAVADFQKRMEE
jgi:hypothetical protein